MAARKSSHIEVELARSHEEERLRLEREAKSAKKRTTCIVEEYERVILLIGSLTCLLFSSLAVDHWSPLRRCHALWMGSLVRS
uniref:Uncharacterized protein n=1 Tax=Oryza rufipogon TaxID=4529 RepID=A0A0E0PL93_ORYRU